MAGCVWWQLLCETRVWPAARREVTVYLLMGRPMTDRGMHSSLYSYWETEESPWPALQVGIGGPTKLAEFLCACSLRGCWETEDSGGPVLQADSAGQARLFKRLSVGSWCNVGTRRWLISR